MQHRREDEFVFGSISNSFTVGGIIKLSNDQVCLNDGRFEVFIVKNPGTLKNWVDVCTSVLKKDFDKRFIHLYQGSHIEVNTLDGSKLPWTLDGEYGIDSNGRKLIFDDVVVRVSPKFALAMHIDTDESNAAAATPGLMGEIL